MRLLTFILITRVLVVAAIVAVCGCGGPLETLGERDDRADRHRSRFDTLRVPSLGGIFGKAGPERGGGLSVPAAAALDRRCPGLVQAGQNAPYAAIRCAIDASPLPFPAWTRVITGREDADAAASDGPPLLAPGRPPYGSLRNEAQYRAKRALDAACPGGGNCTRNHPRYGAGEFGRGAAAAPGTQQVAPGEAPVVYEAYSARCRQLGCKATGDAVRGSDGSLLQVGRRPGRSDVVEEHGKPVDAEAQQRALDEARRRRLSR